MTHKFNRGDKTTILNGYQNYLKRMTDVIPDEVSCAKALGYNLGIKLIRGAYMIEERTLAEEQGRESPIFDTIEGTHAAYNTNLQLIIRNMSDKDALLLGCHNVDSVELAKGLLQELGYTDNRVRFAQLKGFSDQLTSALARANYHVMKFLPYGPTEVVMPYLIRRGQESKQVLREQEFQNKVLKSEIKRRLTGSC